MVGDKMQSYFLMITNINALSKKQQPNSKRFILNKKALLELPKMS
jgi:hypothetical protein